ncbi:hypothetical protein BO94DRAFT_581790 [Aspergillus sclerotioniger CBS 115572]|uniref:Uncharacterized protein n=1 Tax=Aspergillus sclerotioniger CBS 115572 TaxID=1450535 RepID=A0A317X703_9EURO|nr:hypothetical protein BO94DRAFT_581790 [Aspergillus sclerotioniger CBS 115572]PWY94396.1 hypothetical protein BO94DRAFT_581790 [Aspergillus sclerotioniger CBS 115572]
MEPTNFTFLNTTGASSLSKPATKRMRAHITKTNFAKRRQRIADATATKRSLDVSSGRPGWVSVSEASSASAFRRLQELSFLEGNYTPENPRDEAWLSLIASEPALIEALLAVAVRQWSPGSTWQLQADNHSYTAVKLVKQLITSTRPKTDGVLGAVVSMAIGAALTQDQVVWNIHINGLVDIVKSRQFQALPVVPSWFIDFLVQLVLLGPYTTHANDMNGRDSINSIFGFPRVYHQSIVEALGDDQGQRISKLANICNRVIQLRELMEFRHQHQFDAYFIAREIEEPLARLHYELRALRVESDAQVDAAARAIELVLYLLWPSSSGAHLTLLAAELKDAICRFPIKCCYYMNLTSFQLMVGAIAAEEGSLTRAWFVDRLARAVRVMHFHGWNEPLGIMQRKLTTDVGLNGRFRALWRELHHTAVNAEDL